MVEKGIISRRPVPRNVEPAAAPEGYVRRRVECDDMPVTVEWDKPAPIVALEDPHWVFILAAMQGNLLVAEAAWQQQAEGQ